MTLPRCTSFITIERITAFSRLTCFVIALCGFSVLATAQDALRTTVSASADLALIDPETVAEVNPPLPVAESPDNGSAIAADGADASGIPRRFHYELKLGIRGIYDDNINNGHLNRSSDYTTAIEPSLLLALGDSGPKQENYLLFVYAPSAMIYAEHGENNAIQQLVHLEAQYRFSRLTLNIREDIQMLDGTNLDIATATGTVTDRANLDVSGRTKVNIFNTRLDASYYLAGKTFISSDLGLTINDYNSLISSQAVYENVFLNYVYGPKLTVGVGGGAGYNSVEQPNPDQTFEQAALRVQYQATGKITLNATGGVEFRQFDGNRDTYITPVFDVGATYNIFDGTTFTLNATRNTMNSAVLGGQDFSNTNVIFGVTQRLLQRFAVGVTVGYERSDYFSTIFGIDSTRNDNYYFVQPSVDVAVTRFWSVGAYYLRRQNDSSLDSFTFYDNQFGLRSSLTF